jgi:hypothetical protein
MLTGPAAAAAAVQGLTLIHDSACREHLLWDTVGGFSEFQ